MRSQSTVLPIIRTLLFFVRSLVLVALLAGAASAQGLGPFDRDSAHDMLMMIKSELKKNYYDANYHGMDVDARIHVAEEELKLAQTRDELMISVAQVLLELNDSHTFFVPPIRAARVRYGWRMRMIGDTCSVTAVNPKSDAAAKGLKPGDALLTIDGVRPTPEILWKMNYRYYALIPAMGVRLLVRSPGEAKPRQLDVASKVERTAVAPEYYSHVGVFDSETHYLKNRGIEQGDVILWQMPDFELEPDDVDQMMNRVKKFKTLILDLRGNEGGYQVSLERLAGYFFDHDIKIADLKGRKEMKPVMAKTHGQNTYQGKLIVLVDSESASAAEMFARLVQLEKRGQVIGDRTAGAVMTARGYDHQVGVGGTLYYGINMTIADVIMSDGKSLEHVGVTPDEIAIPKPEDLAAHRDTVLSKAAALAGIEVTPEKAGSLFPLEWLD
jgi:C-terminal processing protease CtpA/Prc